MRDLLPIGTIVELRATPKRYFGGRATIIGHWPKVRMPYLVERWGEIGLGRRTIAVSAGEFQAILAAPAQTIEAGTAETAQQAPCLHESVARRDAPEIPVGGGEQKETTAALDGA